ncbi:MAG: hypothetical protein IKS48_11355 [Eubacterium sp.]|nr:hypothetical protein [Eubacterium sp.]
MRKRKYVLAVSIAAMCALSACGKKDVKTATTTEAQVTTEAAITTEEEKTDKATATTANKEDQNNGTKASVSEVSTKPITTPKEYSPVLMEVYNMIQGGTNPDNPGVYEYIEADSGIVEEISNTDSSEIIKSLGYTVEDLNGDGVQELLIGKDDADGKSVILSAYTFNEEGAVKIFEGNARGSFTWMGDGHFHYNGSDGANDVSTGEAHLSEDGTELVWDDYYYTSENEDGEVAIFHNTLGERDDENSEAVTMTEEEFGNIKNNYNSAILPWTSIGSFSK